MTAILAMLLLLAPPGWQEPTEDATVTGALKWHNRFPEVAVNRGLIDSEADYRPWLDAQHVDGGFASISCGDLGRRIYVSWPDGTLTSHIVIDCAQPYHYASRVAKDDIGEVGKDVAMARGMRGPVNATVIYRLPMGPYRPN